MRSTERGQFLVHDSMPAEQERISTQLLQGVSQPEVLFWQYDQAAVIMGCSQRPDAEQLARAERAGVPIMRRGSGGGAVLAGPWMLSITVFIPTDHEIAKQNIIEIFGWFEQIWISTLEQCGVPCKGVDQALIAHSKAVSAEQQLQWACYAALSHGEIVSLDNRKLVGLAQIRKRKGIALVSGLHLSACDWAMLSEVVVNRREQGELLEQLNADAEQLSGVAAEQLLPQVVEAFKVRLSSDFSVLSA